MVQYNQNIHTNIELPLESVHLQKKVEIHISTIKVLLGLKNHFDDHMPGIIYFMVEGTLYLQENKCRGSYFYINRLSIKIVKIQPGVINLFYFSLFFSLSYFILQKFICIKSIDKFCLFILIKLKIIHLQEKYKCYFKIQFSFFQIR